MTAGGGGSREAPTWVPRDPDPPTPSGADRTALDRQVASQRAARRAVPGLIAVLGGLIFGAGSAGAVAGVAVLGLWALATPMYAATAALLLAGILMGGGIATALVGMGALGLLGGWLTTSTMPALTVTIAVLAGGIVSGIGFIGLQLGSPVLATGLLIVAVACGSYGLHRYSMLHLSIIDE